jgi:AraC-like DNA-binding protein
MASHPQLAWQDWSALRGELLWIYDQPVAQASRKLQVDRGNAHWAWLLRRGSLRFRQGSRTLRIQPGTWLFLPKGRTAHEFSADAELLSVHFMYRWPSGESFIRNEKPLVFTSAQYPELEHRACLLAGLVRKHFPDSPNYHIQPRLIADGRIYLRMHSCFHSWLETWLDVCLRNRLSWSRFQSGDDRVLRALGCLNGAALSGGYPRSLLLEQSGLSEVHLTRLFFQEFGVSPRKYWDRRRLEHARTLLKTSETPVKETAWLCGFRSDANFSVWFRRNTGLSPGGYRGQTGRLPFQD